MASEVKRLFEGNWTSYKSENVDALCDKTGVPDAMRQIMLSGDFTFGVQVQGDDITVSGSMGPRKYNLSFKLDQEFPVEGEYNKFMEKGITTFSGGRMKTVLTPSDKSKPLQTVTREIVNGDMLQSVQVEDVISTRYFKRI